VPEVSKDVGRKKIGNSLDKCALAKKSAREGGGEGRLKKLFPARPKSLNLDWGRRRVIG